MLCSCCLRQLSDRPGVSGHCKLLSDCEEVRRSAISIWVTAPDRTIAVLSSDHCRTAERPPGSREVIWNLQALFLCLWAATWRAASRERFCNSIEPSLSLPECPFQDRERRSLLFRQASTASAFRGITSWCWFLTTIRMVAPSTLGADQRCTCCVAVLVPMYNACFYGEQRHIASWCRKTSGRLSNYAVPALVPLICVFNSANHVITAKPPRPWNTART